MSQALFLYRDGALTAIATGNRTSIVAVVASGQVEADAILEAALAHGYLTNFTRISFSNINGYTNATKTIADVAAGSIFADYTWEAGDQLVVTAVVGAGTVAGTYEIASKTDDDTIVLSTAIGGNSTDLSGYIVNVRRIDETDAANLIVTPAFPAQGNEGGSSPLDTPGILYELAITAA